VAPDDRIPAGRVLGGGLKPLAPPVDSTLSGDVDTTDTGGSTIGCTDTCSGDPDCGECGTCALVSGCLRCRPRIGSCTDDGNPCTSDTCSNGLCSHPAKTNGTPCPDDGNVCTSDSCTSGQCTHPAVGNGTPCNKDNNACTANDSCQGGTCTAGSAVVCTPRECNTVACNTTTGACDYTAVGGSCGGNVCSSAGTCSGGACSGTAAITCTQFDTDCTVGVCNPASGCGPTPKPNGMPCTATDKCLQSTTCSGGMCTGTPKTCEPTSICKTAACDSGSGNCVETNKPDNMACDPQNDCVEQPKCKNGQCTGIPLQDGTPCVKADCAFGSACVASKCECVSDGTDLAGASIDMSGGAADMSEEVTQPSGCSMSAARTSASAPIALLLFFGVLFFRRRSGTGSTARKPVDAG
jgi:hypothetical protein